MHIFLIILVIFVLVIAPIWLIADWQKISSTTHKNMTLSNSTKWGYGTFDQFMREFDKRKWKRQDEFPESYFDVDINKSLQGKIESEIHASIIKFDGKGMVLPYWEFRKFQKFIKENTLKVKNKREVIDWTK